MLHEERTYLLDILNCTIAIEEHTRGIQSYSEFKSDMKAYRASEREIEIIAEAINRIRKLGIPIKLNNHVAIVALRNRIIHAYDNVNDELIWGIVKIHVPKLKQEVETLLNNNNETK